MSSLSPVSDLKMGRGSNLLPFLIRYSGDAQLAVATLSGAPQGLTATRR